MYAEKLERVLDKITRLVDVVLINASVKNIEYVESNEHYHNEYFNIELCRPKDSEHWGIRLENFAIAEFFDGEKGSPEFILADGGYRIRLYSDKWNMKWRETAIIFYWRH